MTHPALALAGRLTMRIHGARDAAGERVRATVTPGDGSPAFDVDVVFDRTNRDRTVLGLTLADAIPRLWTLAPETRRLVENNDVITLNGERWHAISRFAREDGLIEHELVEAR